MGESAQSSLAVRLSWPNFWSGLSVRHDLATFAYFAAISEILAWWIILISSIGLSASTSATGFKDEVQDFTPWLARNLDRLGELLGLALELHEIEHPVSRYTLDILANDVTGRLVIVERQLGQSDHDHLGKLLTYAAGTDCRVVIWIATSFSAEHIAAFEWLNRTTTAEVGFYAMQVELLRIGDSALAPYFQRLFGRTRWLRRPAQLARSQTGAGRPTTANCICRCTGSPWRSASSTA